MISLTSLIACAKRPTVNQLAGRPSMPTISKEYEANLMKAGKIIGWDIVRQALSHETEWQSYADKMERRAGY